jgi:hypothetical protein
VDRKSLFEGTALVTTGILSAEVASRSKPANWAITDSCDNCCEQNAEPANSVTADSAAAIAVPASERGSASSHTMLRERNDADLCGSRNATGIWHDLVDQHGFAGGRQSVKRFERPLFRMFVAKNAKNQRDTAK